MKTKPQKEQMDLLAIIIYSNLNFDSHIRKICGKVSQKTTAFARLRDYISGEKARFSVSTIIMLNSNLLFFYPFVLK